MIDSPKTLMGRMVGGYRATQMVYVAAKLGIADLLVAGPRSAQELALATGAHAPSLYRLLRTLSSLGVFAEDESERFALTPLAQLIRSDTRDSLRPFVLSYGEPWWWESWGNLLHSVQTGETAFDHLHGMGFFDYLEQDPEAAEIFNANMTAMTGLEAQGIVAAYDFDGIETLVDIGGGHGELLTGILRAHPGMRGVLFDQPRVIEGAKDHLDRLIADRCELVAGSFFESIPDTGDAYILKDIIHDWDDESALRILRNCHSAIAGRARLLLIERVIPPGNEAAAGKMVDINMLVLTGGSERTDEEYRRLLEAAGFELSRIVPTRSGTSVIESLPR
jgi:hypothetical protein